jgi:hypothetical protein
LNITSFNIGIEAGQVLALAIMLLFLSGWRKTQSPFSVFSNHVIVAGGLLF